MEKITVRRKFLHLDIEALPGAPNQLRVAEGIVGAADWRALMRADFLDSGPRKHHVCVTGSNQGVGRLMVRWPLELGEGGGEGFGG